MNKYDFKAAEVIAALIEDDTWEKDPSARKEIATNIMLGIQKAL